MATRRKVAVEEGGAESTAEPGCSGGRLPKFRLALEADQCLDADLPKLTTPSAIAQFVTQHWGCKPQEFFLALYFDVRNQLLGVHEVSMGGRDQTAVDPKVLFAGALLAGASAMVLAHTHPSGEAEPSGEDVALTRIMVDGAALLSLRVLDHVVVGRGGNYTSMVARGIFPRARASAGVGSIERPSRRSLGDLLLVPPMTTKYEAG